MSGGLLTLDAVRAQAAAALAPSEPDDPDVHDDVVDAIHPPCVMLVWDDPWLEPQTPRGMSNGSGYWSAQFTVRCIAGRVDVESGIETLERMVALVLGRLLADSYTWPAATLSAPRVLQIANVDYLFADVQYRVPVTLKMNGTAPEPPPGPLTWPYHYVAAFTGAPAAGEVRYDGATVPGIRRMYVADQSTDGEDIRDRLMTTADGDVLRIRNPADESVDFVPTSSTGRTGYVEFQGSITAASFVPVDGDPVTFSIEGS